MVMVACHRESPPSTVGRSPLVSPEQVVRHLSAGARHELIVDTGDGVMGCGGAAALWLVLPKQVCIENGFN